VQIHRYAGKKMSKVGYMLNEILPKIDLLISAIVHYHGGSAGK
jgi:hypothetical protein